MLIGLPVGSLSGGQQVRALLHESVQDDLEDWMWEFCLLLFRRWLSRMCRGGVWIFVSLFFWYKPTIYSALKILSI
jgi:hypothetical protein